MDKTLLFDIDGTLLKYNETFSSDRAKGVIKTLKGLVDQGYNIVLITGNDYHVQHDAILQPLIDQQLGPSVFCFSDGGSRAFEYRTGDFVELKDEYSNHNIIDQKDADEIKSLFEALLKDFLEKEPKLLIPNIESYDRTLNYLDLIIYPIKRSFREDEDRYDMFCNEIRKICNNRNEMKVATFEVKEYHKSIIIRAHGQDPESDVLHLQAMIFRDILQRRDFRGISRPEFLKRGGDVICQIALKPFNDNAIRNEFRWQLENIMEEKGYKDFSILTGGTTTIDIQRQGVNKAKAIRYLIREKGYDPKRMIYFGDEFSQFGNDYPVADMPDNERPHFIINVGKTLNIPPRIKKKVILDGNGPEGTKNYLDFLLYQVSLPPRPRVD